MWKKSTVRAVTSMAFSALLCQVGLLIAALCMEEGAVPLVPAYRARFSSDALALSVYVLLVGVIGGAFGGASVLFEIERWSFLKQGVLHFALTTLVWLPIAVLLWGLDQYPVGILTTLLSFALTYGVTWYLNYRRCKRNVREINRKLEEMRR